MNKLISRTLLAVILTVGLVGCSDILPHELLKAEQICKEKGSIHKITGHILKNDVVHCNDGHSAFLNRDK